MSMRHLISMLSMASIKFLYNIKSGVIEGKFPPRALKLTMEWHSQHKDELLNNWNSIMATGEYHKIQPLE